MSQQQAPETATTTTNNISNLSCTSANGNSSSSSLAALVPGGVVTTQNISTVIKPKENNNSMQFVKITPPDLSKKAVEQIRVAQESKITKDKLKEVEEEWQSNLLKWKSKRRQHFVGPGTNGEANEEEQNNNNLENGNGRKVKTFAQIIEQRSKANNRLNFNLQRYIASENEEEEAEADESSEVNGHINNHRLTDQPAEEQTKRDTSADVVDFTADIRKQVDEGESQNTTPKLKSHVHSEPQRNSTQDLSKKQNQSPAELTPRSRPEAPRQPELRPLPRPPTSPKPHLEMLKQKFESLNQRQNTPPVPLQRPVLSSNRQTGQVVSQRPAQELTHQTPPAPPQRHQQQQQNLPQRHHQSQPPPNQQATKHQLVPQAPSPPQQQQPFQSNHSSQRLVQQSTTQRTQESQSLSTPFEEPSKPLLRPDQCHEELPIVQQRRQTQQQRPAQAKLPSPQLQPQHHTASHQNPRRSPPELPRRSSIESPLPLPQHQQLQHHIAQKPPQPHPPASVSSKHKTEEKDRTVLSVSGKRRCSSCKEELGRGAAAFVVESLNLVYHTNCFKCSVCHVDLSNGFRGVDVRVHAGALHCQNCYSKDGLNYSRV